MDNAETLAYGKYITSLISAVILGNDAPAPFEGMDAKKLFELADKHSVAIMIYPAVKNMELSQDAKALFEKNKNRMVARTTRQTIEAERVTAKLEENSIKYILLKGSHIRRLYPADYLRTFGDIDLYLSETDRKKAVPIMRDLGYSLTNVTDYHDEYEKGNFHIFELHSHILSPASPYCGIFENPFSKSVACNGSEYCYELNNEYFYLHLFLHLHKHFSTTGCGIRLFADLLVFESQVKNFDKSFVEKALKDCGLWDFYLTVNKLMDYFFYGKPADESTKAIAEYIFDNEANGLYKYHVASLSFFGKLKYFMKNWFPSAKDLSFRYPVLNKAPVLLPVCWVRRIFYSLFFNRKAFKAQADSIKTANSDEYKHIKEIRRMAEHKK